MDFRQLVLALLSVLPPDVCGGDLSDRALGELLPPNIHRGARGLLQPFTVDSQHVLPPEAALGWSVLS